MSAIFFRAALFTTFLAGSGALAGSALANGNHHSGPLGGRSALMGGGGTGIALGADGAAPFLNPATIARVESLLGGLATDLSALPERKSASAAQRVFRSRLDLLAASFGMAYYGKRGDLLLGLRGDYGSGETAVVNPFVVPSRLEIVDQREWGVMLILAGRVSLENLGLAADRVDDALTGAAPEPAAKPREPMRRAPGD